MRYWFFIVLLFISFPVSAQNAVTQQAAAPVQRVLIRSIVIEGFVLEDKEQFVKLFKPYRNKYLTTSDMDSILHQLQEIYEEGGYQQLVSITYHVDKHRLTFTALMTS